MKNLFFILMAVSLTAFTFTDSLYHPKSISIDVQNNNANYTINKSGQMYEVVYGAYRIVSAGDTEFILYPSSKKAIVRRASRDFWQLLNLDMLYSDSIYQTPDESDTSVDYLLLSGKTSMKKYKNYKAAIESATHLPRSIFLYNDDNNDSITYNFLKYKKISGKFFPTSYNKIQENFVDKYVFRNIAPFKGTINTKIDKKYRVIKK